MIIQASGLLLDACVLSLISKEDAYGYNLTQRVKSALGVSESTLYPVMRRLQTEGSLTAYDIPYNGRNRRYYQITSTGREKYNKCAHEWQSFSSRVNDIMLEGRHDKN